MSGTWELGANVLKGVPWSQNLCPEIWGQLFFNLINIYLFLFIDILQPLIENPRPLLAKAKFYFSKIEETVTNDNDVDLKLSSSLIELLLLVILFSPKRLCWICQGECGIWIFVDILIFWCLYWIFGYLDLMMMCKRLRGICQGGMCRHISLKSLHYPRRPEQMSISTLSTSISKPPTSNLPESQKESGSHLEGYQYQA